MGWGVVIDDVGPKVWARPFYLLLRLTFLWWREVSFPGMHQRTHRKPTPPPIIMAVMLLLMGDACSTPQAMFIESSQHSKQGILTTLTFLMGKLRARQVSP